MPPSSPLFIHLRSEFILEGCLTEFLSAWWLENISIDLVFLYSRFSISREFNCLKSTVGRQKVGRLKIDGPTESCQHVLEKVKLENAGFGIVRFIQSFGLFEKIRIVNKVMRSQGEQTRKSWVFNNNYNMYQEVTSRKTLKLNLKIIYSGWLIKWQKKENYERKKIAVYLCTCKLPSMKFKTK